MFKKKNCLIKCCEETIRQFMLLLNIFAKFACRQKQANYFLQYSCLECAIIIACFIPGHAIPVLADEHSEFEALLELEPFDWSTVETGNLIDQCTLALKNRSKLKEQQVARLLLLRATASIMEGNDPFALRDLTELLTITPNDYIAYRLRGDIYSRRGDNDKAKADFEKVIRLQPKSAVAYASIAIILNNRGLADESKKFAEKAIELDPNESQGYLALAMVHFRNKHYREVINSLNQCIMRSHGYGTREAARPFLLRALVFLEAYDDPKKALPDLLMARRIDESRIGTTCLFFEYYFKTGKYNLAFKIGEHISKWSKNRQNRTNGLVVRFDCHIARKQYIEALNVAESIVRDDPQWPGAFLHRGMAFFAQAKYKEALQDYDKSLKLDHDNLGTMAAKAYLLATCPEGQFRDGSTASKLATKCCEMTQYQVPRQLMLLAMASAECGDYKEAVRWAKKSLEKADPDFPFLEDYRKRLALFEQGKPYRFSPNNRIIDYLFP